MQRRILMKLKMKYLSKMMLILILIRMLGLKLIIKNELYIYYIIINKITSNIHITFTLYIHII
jgi:hypothetical protein